MILPEENSTKIVRRNKRLCRFVINFFIILSLFLQNFLFIVNPVYAASSPLIQNDWSGGSGQTNWSDATKYSSDSSVTTSTANQVTLTQTSPWLTLWAYRKQITISTANVDADLTDYPVLLKLSTSSGIGGVDLTSIFTELGTNSLKLAVTGSDGMTQYPVEVVSWDATNKLAELWVKVPIVSGSVDTTLYIYYDSTHADNTSYVGITGSVPGKAVWDNNYVEVLHGNDVTPSSSNEPTWSKVTKTFDATDVKPFILGGQRYIARSKSFGNGADAIKIYSADANWNEVALITTAPTATQDLSGVHVFPTLGNKVIFWGRGNNGRGFVAQYDFDTSTWTMTSVPGTGYIARIIYRPADSLFYISTSYTVSGDAYYNKLVKSTAANLLTPANWVTVSLPAWGGTDVEAIFSISGNYLYLMQSDDYKFYWQLSKWDFNSTWTPIESNLDGSPALAQDMIPIIGANDNLIVVPEAYNTPSNQWRIRTSTDGITWQTAYTLPMLPAVSGRENACEAFLNGNSFLISLTSTNSTAGYFLLSDQSGNSQTFTGVTSHYGESSIGDVLTDGVDMVMGGQNPYGPTQLNILRWGITTPGPTLVGSKTGTSYPKNVVGEPIEADGGIGKAQNFDGINDYVNGGTNASLFTGTGDLTVDALIKQSNTANSVMMLYLGSDSNLNSVYLFVNSAGNVEFGSYNLSALLTPHFAKGLIQDGSYHTIVGKKSGNDLSISLDGVTKDTKTATGVNITGGYFNLGRGVGTYYWPGFESEVRISNIARSAAYIKANQSNFTDALVTYGATEQQYPSSGTLTSSIFDTEISGGATWGILTYTATTPTNTLVSVKVRTSNSSSMTGAPAFSSCDAITSGTDISTNNCVTDYHRYVQYLLTLSTSAPASTPIFTSFSLAFSAFDTTGPTGTISNANGSPTNSTTPTFNLTIADAGVGITGAQMQFSCDNSTWSTWENYATPKTDFNIRTGAGCTDADGSKTVYVEYKDSLGNVGSSFNTGAFTLDTTSSIATLSNTPTSLTNSTSASITIAGTDITAYKYKLDAGSYGSETVIATTIALSSLSDGSHTLSVIGKDSADNWQAEGSATTYTWTVDTTAPVVTFIIPATSDSLTISFATFSATDANGATGYLVNESATTPSISDAGWSGTAQTQYVFTTDGAKTLYAWVKDEVGNISTSGSGAVTVTLPAPAVSHSGGGGCYGCYVNPSIPSGGFKMSINGSASTTSNRNVFLGFNAGADIKKMAISMTGDFTDASQENYIASKQWDLCSKLGGAVKNPTCPDGKYTVYAKFYTAYGRSSDMSIASSTITLKSGTTSVENLQQYTNLPFTNPFTKYLQYRQTNTDIKRLQIFLNSNPDTKVADSGAGSPGKETNFFGLLTKKAVIKFQEKYAKDILAPWGFVKGTGYVGKTTLAKINELMGNK